MNQPTAEIITIGTELLLGDIVDTNSVYIARQLSRIGVNLFRTTTIGDNLRRIGEAVRQALHRAQIIITTGGLGPTIDDMTRQGIALAVGVETEFSNLLWEQIQERFARYGRTPTENNRRQAYIPIGATPIENPVGTAPAFLVETNDSLVVAVPGVPAEMEYLLQHAVIPYIHNRFKMQQVIVSHRVRTAGVGESWVDERIGDLEKMENPTVGLAAHPGSVDIRVAAKAETPEQAESMIEGVVVVIKGRLGEAVFGMDETSLQDVVMDCLQGKNWHLACLECGTDGTLLHLLSGYGTGFAGGWLLPNVCGITENLLQKTQDAFQADIVLGIQLQTSEKQQKLELLLKTPERSECLERTYGGPVVNVSSWAAFVALDFTRRYFLG